MAPKKHFFQILTFHRILNEGEEYFIPPMALRGKTFEKLVEWLARKKRIVDLTDAVNRIGAGANTNRLQVALTFDDGYRDNYDVAREILLRKGIPATFFIPVHQIESCCSYWWDEIYEIYKGAASMFLDWLRIYYPELSNAIYSGDRNMHPCRRLVRTLNEYPKSERMKCIDDMKNEFGPQCRIQWLMTWTDIRKMHQEGFVIGSHSMSHIPLTDLGLADAEYEITESKAVLSQRIGGLVEGFSYPRGAWNRAISHLVRKAGYKYGVITRFGGNDATADIYSLSRRNISDYEDWFRSQWPVPFHLIEISGMLDSVLSSRR